MIIKNILLLALIMLTPGTRTGDNHEGIIFFDKFSFVMNESGLLRRLYTGKPYYLNTGQEAVINILKRNEYYIGTCNPLKEKSTPSDFDIYLSQINQRFSKNSSETIFSLNDSVSDTNPLSLFKDLLHKAKGQKIYFVSDNKEKLQQAQQAGLIPVYAENNEPLTIIRALNQKNAKISTLNYVSLNPNFVLRK